MTNQYSRLHGLSRRLLYQRPPLELAAQGVRLMIPPRCPTMLGVVMVVATHQPACRAG